MRIGLFTDALAHRELDDALDWIARELPGLHDVEVGTGGYSPARHCDVQTLLASEAARDEWHGKLAARGLQVAALNVSGNPLEADDHERALCDTVLLARLLDVNRVVCMSGGRPELSGGAWFPGVEEAREAYWRDRVEPYWRELAAFAGATWGELRLCLELEPGAAAFTVSTAERLLELGPSLAVNLDPSHFLWQGVDPLAATSRLAGRIGYAHGKDTFVDPQRVAVDGLLDRETWRYATVGHGNGPAWWRAFVEALRAAGYDGVVSIEYEDPLLSPEASVLEAAELLAGAIGSSQPLAAKVAR